MSMNGFDTVLYNSDYLVVEYMDLIKMPSLLLLSALYQNDRLREILSIEKIDFMNSESLVEWYINRKHKNIFMELNRFPNINNEEFMDKLLDEQLNSSDIFYKNSIPLKGLDFIKFTKEGKLAKNIIIYYPFSNDYAKKDLKELLGYDLIFMSDFKEVIDTAGFNSTYFLSDINHVLEMKNANVLARSSIILPKEYRYNKINMTDYKIDLKTLSQEKVFKYAFFNACNTSIYF